MPETGSIRAVDSTERRLVTDGRTDGRTDGQTHDDSKFLGHIFFTKAEDTSTSGHTWKLAKKHFRCDSRLYFFSQRVINRRNNLSQEDVDAQSINCFENRLEKRRTGQSDFSKDL